MHMSQITADGATPLDAALVAQLQKFGLAPADHVATPGWSARRRLSVIVALAVASWTSVVAVYMALSAVFH